MVLSKGRRKLGGGIFSYLPVAAYGERVGFEEHFRTPHGLDLGAVARAYSARFTRASSWEHFRTALKDSFAARGVSVISLAIDPEADVAQHRAIDAAVARALGAGRGGTR